MSISTLQSLHGYIPGLLTPTHPYIPFGLIDLYGASRLSCVIEWIASGVFDPPSPSSTTEKKGAKAVKPRATLLQELFGLMVVLFGGETFLGEHYSFHHDIMLSIALCTGSPPSWLLSPKVALLFGITRESPTGAKRVSELISRYDPNPHTPSTPSPRQTLSRIGTLALPSGRYRSCSPPHKIYHLTPPSRP